MNEEDFKKLKKIVGNNIRIYRLKKNLSQKELGVIANLDRNYIGGVERGERNISLKNLFKIAKGLDTTMKSLFL